MKTQTKRTLAELAADAAVPARTIRFYIARGLLAPPETAGRGAVYNREHLERLEAIKRLQARGLTLAEIAGELGGKGAELPPPSAWWSYPIQSDVMVWVRADASPWRLRRVRRALEQMAAQLEAAAKESDENDSE